MAKTHALNGAHFTRCGVPVERIGGSYYDRRKENGNALIVDLQARSVTCRLCINANFPAPVE